VLDVCFFFFVTVAQREGSVTRA